MPSSPFSQASWIASSTVGSPAVGVAAPYMRTSFFLSRSVKSATLSVTALGLYECEINGNKAGDLSLAPGWTNYNRRVYFQNFDVSAMLRKGENAIGALLGDGWYCGSIGWKRRQNYGDRPLFIAQLSISYTDGRSEIIPTDSRWKTAASPILRNDLLAGETYDARLELPGWSSPGFDDARWQPADIAKSPDILLELPPGPPIRCVGKIQPVSMIESES